MKSKQTSKTITTQSLSLTGDDIVALLRATKAIPEGAVSTSVVFRVPGGGDWSNTTLPLNEFPLEITVVSELVIIE